VTIKFACSCGKRLRARDEMARRRTICPRCGQPVGIPSGQPTHAGTAAAPMTQAERLRLAARRVAPVAEPEAVAPPRRTATPPSATAPRDRLGMAILALLAGRRAPGYRSDRQLETHWYGCLAYPLHDWRLWAGPAVVAATLLTAGLLLMPRLFADRPVSPSTQRALVACGVLALFVVAGYPCSFLGGVLRSAASGEGATVTWSGHTVPAALRAAAVWLLCFLAGPVIFAAVAAAYWMQCGDPNLLDWLILAELGAVTVGYGLLVLAAVAERGRLLDANPVYVIDLAHRLGWRAAVITVAGSVLVLGHGVWAVFAASEVHRGWVGLPLLAGCWLSAVFWATFLFRLLGVWCYRSRARQAKATPVPQEV
jgi:hypothetical protein